MQEQKRQLSSESQAQQIPEQSQHSPADGAQVPRPESEDMRHCEIAAQLVAELRQKGRLPLLVTLRDENSGEHYSVEVTPLLDAPTREEDVFRTFIVGGPAGVPCGCCNGSGVRPARP